MEEGKEAIAGRATQSNSRVFPLRVLQFFVLFLFVGLGFFVVSLYAVKYFNVQGRILVAPVAESNIRPCFEESSRLWSWIRPPSNLLHTMNDSELFWRASFMPRIKTYPFKRKPKIAFMFLTKGPLPLAPLWERFFKGNEDKYSIYVHSLPSYHADFPPTSVFYQRQIPSQVPASFDIKVHVSLLSLVSFSSTSTVRVFTPVHHGKEYEFSLFHMTIQRLLEPFSVYLVA